MRVNRGVQTPVTDFSAPSFIPVALLHSLHHLVVHHRCMIVTGVCKPLLGIMLSGRGQHRVALALARARARPLVADSNAKQTRRSHDSSGRMTVKPDL
jgi:hypothetical protein